MCAISTFPEASDASIMSGRRKYSVASGVEDCKRNYLLGGDKNTDTRYSSTVPSSSINTVKNKMCNGFMLIQDDPLRRISEIEYEFDHYNFPYYRSNKINNFQDAVLVKDVGICCNLLNDTTAPISGFESYLVRQLKLEYNELSNIMRKINTYTKDILSNLTSRNRKKDYIFQKTHAIPKHVMASQYIDEEGNPCLKLRVRDYMEKKHQPSEINLNNNSSKKFSSRELVKNEVYRDIDIKKKHTELNKISSKKILETSPKCSNMLLRNYLIMKRNKVSNKTSKISLRQTENFAPSDRTCKDRNSYKSRKFFYTNKYDPFVFTNWKEVSRRKECRSKNTFTSSISGESRCTDSIASTLTTQNLHRSILGEKRGHHGTNNNYLNDTDFHVFNIRIK